MSDELKTIKFQLMLSPSEAEAIDEWGFKNRIRTRAEAIRRLCQIGLNADARLETVAELIQVASEWMEETRRHQVAANQDRDPEQPAPLDVQTNFIGSMVLLSAKLATQEMITSSERLRQVEDLTAALEASIEHPEMAGARDALQHFLDEWKMRFPGMPIRPAPVKN